MKLVNGTIFKNETVRLLVTARFQSLVSKNIMMSVTKLPTIHMLSERHVVKQK